MLLHHQLHLNHLELQQPWRKQDFRAVALKAPLLAARITIWMQPHWDFWWTAAELVREQCRGSDYILICDKHGHDCKHWYFFKAAETRSVDSQGGKWEALSTSLNLFISWLFAAIEAQGMFYSLSRRLVLISAVGLLAQTFLLVSKSIGREKNAAHALELSFVRIAVSCTMINSHIQFLSLI